MSNNDNQVDIPDAVFEEFETVRVSAVCNMVLRNEVQRAAYDMDCYTLVLWIEDNRNNYSELLMRFSEWKARQNATENTGDDDD